jgi:rare lipoprotein A
MDLVQHRWGTLELAMLALAACVHGHDGGPDARAPATGTETPLDGHGRSAPSGQGDDAVPPGQRSEVQVGYATWYGGKLAGHRTSSGERFDPSKMTAAHRTLPFGTWVEVKRVDTGQSVRVRITDRGPWGHDDRIIDLARAAASKIDLVRAGMTKVEVRVVAGPAD